MNFSDYYQSLERVTVSPQKALRLEVMKTCDCSEATVFRWLSGDTKPGKLQREAISNLLGIAQDELFPEDKGGGK